MPKLILSARKGLTSYGVFRASKNEVVVYIHKHKTVRELTNTIIHEFVHATQKKKAFNMSYEDYNNSVGYWNNPYEIEARNIAKEKEEECILELIERFRIFR